MSILRVTLRRRPSCSWCIPGRWEHTSSCCNIKLLRECNWQRIFQRLFDTFCCASQKWDKKRFLPKRRETSTKKRCYDIPQRTISVEALGSEVPCLYFVAIVLKIWYIWAQLRYRSGVGDGDDPALIHGQHENFIEIQLPRMQGEMLPRMGKRGHFYRQKVFAHRADAMNVLARDIFGRHYDVVFDTNLDDFYAPTRFALQIEEVSTFVCGSGSLDLSCCCFSLDRDGRRLQASAPVFHYSITDSDMKIHAGADIVSGNFVRIKEECKNKGNFFDDCKPLDAMLVQDMYQVRPLVPTVFPLHCHHTTLSSSFIMNVRSQTKMGETGGSLSNIAILFVILASHFRVDFGALSLLWLQEENISARWINEKTLIWKETATSALFWTYLRYACNECSAHGFFLVITWIFPLQKISMMKDFKFSTVPSVVLYQRTDVMPHVSDYSDSIRTLCHVTLFTK